MSMFRCFYNREGDFGGPNIDFIVFIMENIILEVQILICHCFYNRKGVFGGPKRDFLLLVLANINYFDICL